MAYHQAVRDSMLILTIKTVNILIGLLRGKKLNPREMKGVWGEKSGDGVTKAVFRRHVLAMQNAWRWSLTLRGD